MTHLENWLSRIEQLHPEEIELGLDRVNRVANKLQCKDFHCSVITVAGTNGKGSCVELLTQFALQAGKKVGAYTSPHLFNFNERVSVNGNSVSDDDLVHAFERIEEARNTFSSPVSLSYFEYTTLAALLIFKQLEINGELDLLLLEVGLGGRLDAVNIVDADLAIISSIGIDHEAWLGNDRNHIAKEKLGVARENKKLVVGEEELTAQMHKAITATGAQACILNRDYSYTQKNNLLTVMGLAETLEINLSRVQLAPQNIATASIAYSMLPFPSLSSRELQEACESAKLKGRFQTLTIQGRELVADLTHNPAGARFLREQLENYRARNSFRKVHAVFGVMADKDYLGIIEALHDLVSVWYLCDLNTPRAISAIELQEAMLNQNASLDVHGFESPEAAVEYYLGDDECADDLLLVLGSFYTVAPVLQQFS